MQHIKPNILRVKGRTCGIVSSVSHQAAQGDNAEIAEVIRGWEPKGLQSEMYKGQESLLHAFVTVIRRNRPSDRYSDHGYTTLQQWTQTYLEAISGTPNGSRTDALNKSEVLNCLDACRSQRFIVSGAGHIGSGPDGAQVGKYCLATCLKQSILMA